MRLMFAILSSCVAVTEKNNTNFCYVTHLSCCENDQNMILFGIMKVFFLWQKGCIADFSIMFLFSEAFIFIEIVYLYHINFCFY